MTFCQYYSNFINMARVKIELPPSVLFTAQYKVSITDINYGNHLGNDRVLAIAHESRMQFFRSLGITDEKKVDGVVGIIMADAAVIFRAEAFHGDDLLIELGLTDPGSSGFDMIFRILRKVDAKEIALVKAGIVTFNYESRRVVRMPEGFTKKLGF